MRIGDLFVEGFEVFCLLAAGGLKAAQAYERQKERRASQQREALYRQYAPEQLPRDGCQVGASTQHLARPTPSPSPAAERLWMADLALFGAVAAGAIVRRTTRARDAAAFGVGPGGRSAAGIEGDKAPTTVLARVRHLEMNQDRIAEGVNRANRDLSKVATRVRLTRRELSPPVRKMEATAEELGAATAALERKVTRLQEELEGAQGSMLALHDVTAKQFAALAAAVKDAQRSQGDAEPAGADRPGVTDRDATSATTSAAGSAAQPSSGNGKPPSRTRQTVARVLKAAETLGTEVKAEPPAGLSQKAQTTGRETVTMPMVSAAEGEKTAAPAPRTGRSRAVPPGTRPGVSPYRAPRKPRSGPGWPGAASIALEGNAAVKRPGGAATGAGDRNGNGGDAANGGETGDKLEVNVKRRRFTRLRLKMKGFRKAKRDKKGEEVSGDAGKTAKERAALTSEEAAPRGGKDVGREASSAKGGTAGGGVSPGGTGVNDVSVASDAIDVSVEDAA